MASWVDRIILWLIVSVSAFFLMFVLTDGAILPSAVLAFLIVLAIRTTVGFIPDKYLLNRRARALRINALIRSWSKAPSETALAEISCLLPGFIPNESACRIIFLNRIPDGEAFSANELLTIWHAYPAANRLFIILTGPASSAAFTLADELACPSVSLIDQARLTKQLLPVAHRLPQQLKQKKKGEPLHARLMRLSGSIRPVRVCSYLLLNMLMYLLTDSIVWLASAIALLLLLILRFCRSRIIRSV